MRKALGALLALLISSPVLAADKGGPVAQPAPVEVQYSNWNRSAFYVGLGAGYTISQMQADDFKFSNAGLQGGLFGGYNYNMGNGVTLGVEADYYLGSLKGETSTGGYTLTASNHFLASVRGRAGLNAGPMLLYVTAGPAFTERKAAIQTGPFVSDWKDLQMGAAFGGGIDAEITRTLFLRLEAIHYIFPDKSVDGAAGFFKASDQQTSVRVGIGFKLN